MKVIQTYKYIFLLVACMLATPPNRAMDQFTIQIKDTIIGNSYISGSILTSLAIGSYLYFKGFFESKEVIKPLTKQKKIQELSKDQGEKPLKQQLISPNTDSVMFDNKSIQFITVENDNDQSLDLHISNTNDDSTDTFSVPGHSYSLINIS